MPIDPNEVGISDPSAGPENVRPQDPLTEWTGRRILEQLVANGSGSGGGAATIADGADVAEGAKADATVVNPASSASVVALQKGILTQELAILAALNARLGKGAANLATSQVTSTGAATTLAIARPTRRSVLFTNTSTTGSVWVGPATVTAGNGQIIGPGQSCPFTWVGLFQVIDDNTTHCVICISDEYD